MTNSPKYLAVYEVLKQTVDACADGEKLPPVKELCETCQVSLATLLSALNLLEKDKSIPQLPGKIAKPTIVAGMEALGRGNDLNKLRTFLATLTETIGPQQVAQWVNVPDVISRVGVSVGVDMTGLIKTAEQVQEEQQQAQQMAMLQQVLPNGINQIGQMIQNAQKGEQQTNDE